VPEIVANRRLDQPRVGRRFALDPEGFARVSERIARFLGTGRYLAIQTMIVIVWIVFNLVAIGAWEFDPYPFILLNLAFSTQAAYAAPLILLAQNRQDDRDRVALEQDRQRAERNLADTEFLAREMAALRIGLNEVATRDFVRSELRNLLEELTDRDGDDRDTREHREGRHTGRDGRDRREPASRRGE